MNSISGVRHVVSVSREGLSSVVVEFELEVDIDDVSLEARAKINATRSDLPDEMQEPVIQKFDFGAMPVISLALRSTVLPPRELTILADRKVKRRLESLPGVARAKLIGDSTREIAVSLDPARLAALRMGVDEIIGGLSTENVNTPLGRLTDGGREIPLRMAGKPPDPRDYESMVISRRGVVPVRLGDLARVDDTIQEQRSLAFIDGEPAVAIDITKQTKANTVAVVDAVRVTIDEIRRELPASVEIQIVRDSSVFIREAVADVRNTLVLGGFLTILIVFCFLNSWRSTVITGLTLPISIMSSFIVMYFLNMTLNMLTLMALSLAIGLLIDDAIVVRENIVRHLEHGEDHYGAARKGTDEIGLAVLATTMSIVAVFVPVAFMKGVIGRFFFQFGLTVAFAVLVSLFVSFTLDPMLSSRWIDPDIQRRGRRHVLQRALDRFNVWFEQLANGYMRVIAWALEHRKSVVTLASVAFFAGLGIFQLLQSEFMTPMDQGEFVVKMKSGPGASIEETRGRLAAVLRALGEFKEVRYTYASIGAGDADTVRDATVFVKLVPRTEREQGLRDFIHDARVRLGRVPGVILSLLEDPDAFQKPLQIAVQGDDIATLKRVASALKRELADVDGIVDIEAAMELDLPEYRLVVDRERAAASGVGSDLVAKTVGVLVGGQAVSTFEDEEGEAVDLRLRLPSGLRADLGDVGDLNLTVASQGGTALVPLSDLVRFVTATSPAEISRRDLSRQVAVDANLDRLPLGTAGQLAMEKARSLDLPPGYKLVMGGDTEMMIESFGYLAEALLLAIIFVYLILAAQFESFIDPLAIMLSLPLSIVGMAGTLVLTGDTVNIMSLIGLIMLMGLVTKNAILLVDYTKVLRAGGLDRNAALIKAGRTRLRPILMTTSAMIFGMLPLFFGLGEGAEFRAPMARAVVGGLMTSTLLTLIVVPVVYSVLDDLAVWLRGGRRVAPAVAGALLLVIGLAGGRVSAAAPAPGAITPPESLGTQCSRAVAAAQSSGAHAPPVTVVTLADALARAAERNRDIVKAIEYQKWVRGRYVEERAAALPHATAGVTWLRTFDNSQRQLFASFMPDTSSEEGPSIGDIFGGRQDVRSAEIRVTQVLFTWGQVGAAIRAARLGFGYADQQLRRFQQAVARDVTVAFYDVLAARALLAIATEDLTQKQRHLAETGRRQLAGTSTDYDVLAAQVVVENATPAIIRGENRLNVAREQLRFLLADSNALDVSGSLDALVQEVDTFDVLFARALEHRPEVAELRSQLGIYGELVTIARAGNKPRLDFSAAWGRRSLDLASVSSSGTTWNAAVSATIPLFDGSKTAGQVAQAQSDLNRLQQDELGLRDSIALQVQTAIDAVSEAAGILRALSRTVEQAERLLFLAEKGFELGVKTRLDVQDAELNLQQARTNLTIAQRDYRVSRVNLDWVVGTLEAGAPNVLLMP
ncbi:MAG: efflux RND transporter permease subunit [Vicinamibacterales bacterium]